MTAAFDIRDLVDLGLDLAAAASLLAPLNEALALPTAEERWRRLQHAVLRPDLPFAIHERAYAAAYRDWDLSLGPAPAWWPDPDRVTESHVARLARELGLRDYAALHRFSVENREEFWRAVIARLDIRFRRPPDAIADMALGVERPRWLPGARLNIVESCLRGDTGATAILWQAEHGPLERTTMGELRAMTARVASGLRAMGLGTGDAVAIDMPMTAESVAIYLAIIAVGGAVVSIADSFAPHEIATRLRIGGAKAIFTQEAIVRGGKRLPLYEKVVQSQAPRAIVLPAEERMGVALRAGDAAWDDFLRDGPLDPVAREPDDLTNVLFSSGTTGDPKAIPWTQTTPIKAAMDGLLHHDIRPGDVVAWPTNLGWMMGPWLIYASLINRASMALYYGAPTSRPFGRFVQDARVTMLGLVPSLVKAWRATGCMEGLDWRTLRAFSSTGECSNASDYLWLMALAGYRPVIEYCGGTEIGGGYITGTVVQPASPSTFSTPSLGLDFVILDEEEQPAANGEVCLVPPSIGLSNDLLNADHHEVYYEGMPRGPKGELLRRHGDQIEALPGGYFRAHGRVDDTMNLGGIKVSSAEIERACLTVAGVVETAAIAINPPGGGPSLLVIYLVPMQTPAGTAVDLAGLKAALQRAIREQLNPLFKIHHVVAIDALPRTASNKVMRRSLRASHRHG